MSRFIGIIASDAAIGSKNGFYAYNSKSEPQDLKVGDTVTFSTRRINEVQEAFYLRKSKPIVEVILEKKVGNAPEVQSVTSKCTVRGQVCVNAVKEKPAEMEISVLAKVLGIMEMPEGQTRHFVTDFAEEAKVGGSLAHLPTNSFMGETVRLEPNFVENIWEVVSMKPMPEKKEFVGLCYAVSDDPFAARMWVPGYPEDFLLPQIDGKFHPDFAFTFWYRFVVFTDTGLVDTSAPFVNVEMPPYFCNLNEPHMSVPCTFKSGVIKTVHDDIVEDPRNVLGAYGVTGDFIEIKHLYIELLRHGTKPQLILSYFYQKQLGTRQSKLTVTQYDKYRYGF